MNFGQQPSVDVNLREKRFIVRTTHRCVQNLRNSGRRTSPSHKQFRHTNVTQGWSSYRLFNIKHKDKHMAEQWNSTIQFPTDSNFINRITGAEFKQSKSSGNPMIQLDCEVISPEVVDVGGEQVNIAGVTTINYFTTKTAFDDEKSAKNLKRCKELIAKLFPDKPEYVEQFNPENPDADMLKAMVGLCVLTQMSPKTEERRKNPTSEQIAKAKEMKAYPQGDVMKHPVSGKALVSYRPEIREIFALAPEGAAANKPY